MDFGFSEVVIPTSPYNVLNWYNYSLHISTRRYWIFAVATRISDASRVMLKFLMNDKNSSGSLLSNKAILNSYRSNFFYVGSLRSLILTQYLSDFSTFLILVYGVGGGFTWNSTIPQFQLFLCEMLSIVDVFVLLWLC